MSLPINPLDALFGGAESEVPHDLTTYQDEQYVVTTEGEFAQAQNPEQPDPNEKDAEDKEIDSKIDQVYDAALAAYNTQTAYTEMIEPRYAARNAEVAANYLNIALQAANSRANVKNNRKKINNQFIPFNNANKHSNTVVASREEMMRLIDDAATK